MQLHAMKRHCQILSTLLDGTLDALAESKEVVDDEVTMVRDYSIPECKEAWESVLERVASALKGDLIEELRDGFDSGLTFPGPGRIHWPGNEAALVAVARGSLFPRVRALGKLFAQMWNMAERIPQQGGPAEEVPAFLNDMEALGAELARILRPKLDALSEWPHENRSPIIPEPPRRRRQSDDQ